LPVQRFGSGMKTCFALSALALCLAACTSDPDPAADRGLGSGAPQGPLAKPSTPATASARTLTLEGLGDLRIGKPVPVGSTWAERGAQIPGECRTVSSPDHPGAYAIVEDGLVRRITIGQRSDVKLAEGIGV